MMAIYHPLGVVMKGIGRCDCRCREMRHDVVYIGHGGIICARPAIRCPGVFSRVLCPDLSDGQTIDIQRSWCFMSM
jgi:hypothetical protein